MVKFTGADEHQFVGEWRHGDYSLEAEYVNTKKGLGTKMPILLPLEQ